MNKFKSQEHIKKVSRYLIKLINRCKENSKLYSYALSVLSYNYPNWYKKFLENKTNIKICKSENLYINKKELQLKVDIFKDKIKNTTKLYILNDAQIFLIKGTKNFKFKISRRDLGEEDNYYELFSLVNKSALKSSNWKSFEIRYKNNLISLLKRNKRLNDIFNKTGIELCSILKNEKNVTFIDTGMQGTFALFMSESIKRINKNIKTDIKLFCVYPWLKEIFKNKFQITDARYLFSLERLAEAK